MNQFTLSLVGAALLTPALGAQVAPAPFAPRAFDQTFSISNFQNLGIYRPGATTQDIVQISFTKSPTVDQVGQWTVCLTVHDLATTYGGSGTTANQFVLMGTYDTNFTPPRFTPNTLANLMNDPNKGNNFGLMMEPRDGMCCALDYNDGIYFSVRPTITAAFPTPIRVTTAVSTPTVPAFYVDPVPCYLEGKLGMIYTDSASSIVFRELKLSWSTTNALIGAEMLAVQTLVTTSTRPHSPTPIIDAYGDVQGLFMAQNTGSDSDMFFLSCINGFDQPQLVFDSTTWANNGGMAGGTLFFANGENTYDTITTLPTAWMVGSHTALGGKATLTVGCSNPQRPFAPCVTQVALSFSLNNGVFPGVAVGGLGGMYGLNGTVFVFAAPTSINTDETAGWEFVVPNNNALRGIRISVQGLAAPQQQLPTFTNTATLSFK